MASISGRVDGRRNRNLALIRIPRYFSCSSFANSLIGEPTSLRNAAGSALPPPPQHKTYALARVEGETQIAGSRLHDKYCEPMTQEAYGGRYNTLGHE